MTASSRASVVSSFTLIKGPMIAETYAVMAQWDLARTKRENLDRLREENYIAARSAAWLRDVMFVLNRRFDPSDRDRPLVTLAKGRLPLDEWKPILVWHMTRDEFLLRDFLENWLFDAYEAGALFISPEELFPYLRAVRERGGVVEHDWSARTVLEVAGSLLRAAVAFGLMDGKTRKKFRPFHLPERSFIYLLHALRDGGMSAERSIQANVWRMYLMRPADVERELLRLHQFKRLHYEAAGSLVELSLPCDSAQQYADEMVA